MSVKSKLDDLMLELWVSFPPYSGLQRSLLLSSAAGLAAGALSVCVLVNDQDSWRPDDPGGWLALLFLPAIAVASHALGWLGGAFAGLLALMLAELAAFLNGDSLFRGWMTTPPTDVNEMGVLLGVIFVLVGLIYGWSPVREAPLWKQAVFLPVSPVAILLLLVWSWSRVNLFKPEVASPTPFGEPQLVLHLADEQPVSDQVAMLQLLDEVSARTAEDRVWVTSQVTDALEESHVDLLALRKALTMAIRSGWDLRELMAYGLVSEGSLGLPEDAVEMTVAGLAAVDLGLSPEAYVALQDVGDITDAAVKFAAKYRRPRKRTTRPGSTEKL